MGEQSFSDQVRDVLAGRRVRVPGTDIATELGLDLDDEEFFWQLEEDDHELKWWPDESWSHIPTLLDGTVTVHRLTAEEIEGGWVHDGPDTAALLAWNPAPVVAGEALELQLRPEPRWRLPIGVLDAAAPGDLLVARHGRDGIELEVVPAGDLELAPLTDDEVTRLHDLVGEVRDDGDLELSDLVLELALVWPEFLTVPRVLSEVLERADLPVVGDFVLAPGEDPMLWQLERRRQGLDPHGDWPDEVVDAVAGIIDAQLMIDRAGELDLPTARGVAAALADMDAFELYVDREFRGWLDLTDRLEGLVDHLDTVLDGDVGAGVHTLRSRLADRRGDLETQQAANAAARRADPQFAPALLDHACDLEDAGEVGRAAALLRRVGIRHDDGQYQRLHSLLEPPYPDVGRNEPCPCGSGRKHKQCHLEGGPTDDVRPHWLLDRMVEWLLRPAQRPLAREHAMAYVDRFDDPIEALRMPVAAGIALFEGGVARRYLAARGGLLEEIDRKLLEDWVDNTRLDALYAEEVTGTGALVRSAVTDRRFELVSEAAATIWPVWGEEIMVGAHVATRPDGSLTAISLGPAPEPLDHLPEVIEEGDPIGLAAWYETHLMLSELVERRLSDD